MLPLRFPNSGIRAKGRPRLPTRGWLDARRRLPVGAAARRGSRLQGTRKGLPPAASPTTNRAVTPTAGWLPLGRATVDGHGQPLLVQGQRRQHSEGE
ncbi:hypothetical protein B296_00058539 [Ensete ventricosum]|uniref:Uncharacterized protein n=1 Tax=Ensete ventricosum TaxID=4639 RepID=A0A426X0T4_ENSVE|nr:hypothetical protein B296_00058539 [Ensete ventricosum]